MKQKEIKTQVNVFLPESIKTHITHNPFIINFTDWVMERYIEEFMTPESLSSKIDELNKNLKWVTKEQEKQEKIYHKNMPPSDALLFLKVEAPKKIKKYEEVGVLFNFNKEFKLEFTMKQFRIWIENLKSKSVEDIKMMCKLKSSPKKR